MHVSVEALTLTVKVTDGDPRVLATLSPNIASVPLGGAGLGRGQGFRSIDAHAELTRHRGLVIDRSKESRGTSLIHINHPTN